MQIQQKKLKFKSKKLAKAQIVESAPFVSAADTGI